MKVVITDSASESLWPIYRYHCQYSEDQADEFQRAIDRFMLGTLGANPLIGHLYHEGRGIRRLIFQWRDNIYYSVRTDPIFVLLIFDGRMEINNELGDRGLDVDALLGRRQ